MEPSSALPPAYFQAGTASFVDFLREVRPDLLPGANARPVTAEQAGHVAAAARHDDRRRGLRRRRRDRRRPSRHDGQPHLLAGHAEGLRHRRLLGGGHRGHGRARRRGGPAVRGRAAALREDRGRLADLRRQGEQARRRWCGATSTPRCRACRSCRCSSGYDLDAADPARAGRIVSYDVVGSRNEETDYAGVGSGSLFAKSALKKRHDPAASAADCVRTLVEALYDAADDDSATGGPDTIRAIYPIVVTIDAEGATTLPARGDRRGRRGRRRRPPRAARRLSRTHLHAPHPTDDPRSAPRHDDAVLRVGRPADARPLGARAQGHRARPQRRRADLRRRRAVRGREPLELPAQGLRDLRLARVRRGRPLQRVREPAHRRHPLRRRPRLLLRPPRRLRPLAGQRLRPDPRGELHRAAEAVRGRAVRGRGRRDARPRPDVPHHLRRVDLRRAPLRGHGRHHRAHQRGAALVLRAGPRDARRAAHRPRGAAGPERDLVELLGRLHRRAPRASTRSRSPSSTAPAVPAARSAG